MFLLINYPVTDLSQSEHLEIFFKPFIIISV